MAEAFLNEMGHDRFEAESAGLEPGKLNPYVIAVMKEVGIDISRNPTKSVFDMLERNGLYEAVITVCDAASAQACPVFPGKVKKLGWSFADPSQFSGTRDEKLEQTRKVRDEIKARIIEFIETYQR